MASSKNSNTIICPECEAVLQFTGKPRAGLRFDCRRCNNTLVITRINPLYIDVAVPKSANSRSSSKAGKKKAYPGASNRPVQPPELKGNSTSAVCPGCSEPIQLKNPPKLRQAIICSNCEEILQVVVLRPLQLAIVDEEYLD